MNKIIEVMKHIALMHPDEKEKMLIKSQSIADYNKKYFYIFNNTTNINGINIHIINWI